MNVLPVVKPPFHGVGREIESACRKAIFDFSLLDQVQKVAVALSGGKDSLCLLFLLNALRGRGFDPFDIVAIHVEGDFSCGAGLSRDFLQGICHELSIPLVVRKVALQGSNIECYSCSRQRRKLIFETAKEMGASTIAFGHHRDDSAQTLLLNLLHKAEFATHLPKLYMYHYGVTIIRPLIYVGEKELRTFAEQHGFLRISCQCPVGQNSNRKKTDRLIRELETVFPHARTNLARAGLLYGSQKAAQKVALREFSQER